MLFTVISNSVTLYGDDGSYGTLTYPRKNIRPRASHRHSPYRRRVDSRVFLADPKKVSRTTKRGQYDAMPVRHAILPLPLSTRPRLGLGMGLPRPNSSKQSPLPVNQRIYQSQHRRRHGRRSASCSSYNTKHSGSLRKGPRSGRSRLTFRKASRSINHTVGIRCHASSNCRQHQQYFTKDGLCQGSPYHEKSNFMLDLITTLVDLKYRWILLVYILCYIVTWTAFAELYFLDSWLRGDEAHIMDQWQPCFKRVKSFHSAVSVDNQVINGYNSRVVTASCVDRLVLMMAQSIFESVLDALLLGCILAKLSMPKRKFPSLLFSQYCAVSKRDEILCLTFDVGALKETHMLVAEIRAKLIKSHHTKEGEFLPLEQREIDLGPNSRGARLFTLEPQTVEHVIDEHSPLWDISA